MSSDFEILASERLALLRRSVRRLVWWNRLWIAIIVLAALWLAGRRMLQLTITHRPTISMDSGGIQIDNMSQLPFIVTELVGDSKYGAVVADLPRPVVLPGDDSGGWYLDAAAIQHLRWYTWKDRESAPTPDLHTIRAMYYQPAIMAQRRQD